MKILSKSEIIKIIDNALMNMPSHCDPLGNHDLVQCHFYGTILSFSLVNLQSATNIGLVSFYIDGTFSVFVNPLHHQSKQHSVRWPSDNEYSAMMKKVYENQWVENIAKEIFPTLQLRASKLNNIHGTIPEKYRLEYHMMYFS